MPKVWIQKKSSLLPKDYILLIKIILIITIHLQQILIGLENFLIFLKILTLSYKNVLPEISKFSNGFELLSYKSDWHYYLY